jgi:hypothetical protein
MGKSLLPEKWKGDRILFIPDRFVDAVLAYLGIVDCRKNSRGSVVSSALRDWKTRCSTATGEESTGVEATLGCGAGPGRDIPGADTWIGSALRPGEVEASSCIVGATNLAGASTPRGADAVAPESDDTKATLPR